MKGFLELVDQTIWLLFGVHTALRFKWIEAKFLFWGAIDVVKKRFEQFTKPEDES